MTRRQEDKVSIRRRRVLMAGGAGMLAPALGMAASDRPHAAHHPFGAGDTLVLSGCLQHADARPLSGRAFEVHGADGVIGQGVSDGAGRFVLELRVPDRAGPLAIRAGAATPQPLAFSRSATSGGNGLAQLQRDHGGLWRAAVGVTFA
jgi:hypothetical protein